MTAAPAYSRRALRAERVGLASARDDRLFFAQVREDPRVELAALDMQPSDLVVAVSSGGCTALSLLGAGARAVHAIDVNRAQNHLVELKAAAICQLERDDAIAFLGGARMDRGRRIGDVPGGCVRGSRSRRVCSGTRASRRSRSGVLNAGVSERFIRACAGSCVTCPDARTRVARMLACRHARGTAAPVRERMGQPPLAMAVRAAAQPVVDVASVRPALLRQRQSEQLRGQLSPAREPRADRDPDRRQLLSASHAVGALPDPSSRTAFRRTSARKGSRSSRRAAASCSSWTAA